MTRSKMAALAAVPLLMMLLSGPAAAGQDEGRDEHGYLGVTLAHMTHQTGDDHEEGLFIVGLVDEGGAKAAGLQPHDRLVAIDGRPVRDMGDVDSVLDRTRPGDRVSVTVRRDETEHTHDVVLTGRPSTVKMEISEGPNFLYITRKNRATLGVRAETLGEQLAEFFGVDSGALITEVIEDGAAWRAGLRAGDVIVGFNGKPIGAMEDLHEALGKAKPGDPAEIEIDRRGRLETYAVTLAEGPDSEATVTIDIQEGITKKIRHKLQQLHNIKVETKED